MTKRLADLDLRTPHGETTALGEVLGDKTVLVLVRYFG